jgi:hypothetical protein
VADDLDAGAVVADVVGCPQGAEGVTAGGKLADEVGEGAVVGGPAGLGAQEGNGLPGGVRPVAVERLGSRVEEDEPAEVRRPLECAASLRSCAQLAKRFDGMTSSDYDVVMAKKAPTPVRFDMMVADRLSAFVSINHGLSLSAAANMLVDEGLRMMEHPGVLFRPGPSGRRAGLAAGPDVWEVVRAVKSARAAEPDLGERELLAMVAENTGVPVRMIRVATGYWAAYPDEIDAELAAADAAEESAERAWRRERELLAG